MGKIQIKVIQLDKLGKIRHTALIQIYISSQSWHVRHIRHFHIQSGGQPRKTGQVHIKSTEIYLKGLLQGIRVNGKKGFHVKLTVLIVFFSKFLSGKNIYLFIRQLLLHNFTGSSLLDHMFGKLRGITDSCSEHGSSGTFHRLDNSHNCQIFSVFHQFFHIRAVVWFILPDLIFFIIFIIIGTVYQLKFLPQDFIIGVWTLVFWRFHCLFCHKFLNHIIQFLTVPKPKSVLEKITDIALWSKHQYTFFIIFRPSSRFHVILILIKISIFRHFMKNISAHGRRHNAVGGTRAQTHSRKRFVRIYLSDIFFIFQKNLGRNRIRILHRICILGNAAFITVQVNLQRLQIIGIHFGEHISHHLGNSYFPILFPTLRCGCSHHHRGKIHSCALYLQRIFWKCFFFHICNVFVYTIWYGKDQRNSDNTDGACKRSK